MGTNFCVIKRQLLDLIWRQDETEKFRIVHLQLSYKRWNGYWVKYMRHSWKQASVKNAILGSQGENKIYFKYSGQWTPTLQKMKWLLQRVQKEFGESGFWERRAFSNSYFAPWWKLKLSILLHIYMTLFVIYQKIVTAYIVRGTEGRIMCWRRMDRPEFSRISFVYKKCG